MVKGNRRMTMPNKDVSRWRADSGRHGLPKHGESMHRELELFIEAGVSVLDALRAATVLPVEHFRLSDWGVIAEGKWADLGSLSEDPTKDIRATRSVARVVWWD